MYIGEDGRLTQLRGELRVSYTLNPADLIAIDTMFRKIAGNSSTSISEETVMLLPSMFRALIRGYFLLLVIYGLTLVL